MLTAFQNYQVWLNDLKNKPLEELIEICKQRNPTWTESENIQWAKGKQSPVCKFINCFTANLGLAKIVSSMRVPGLLLTAETILAGL